MTCRRRIYDDPSVRCVGECFPERGQCIELVYPWRGECEEVADDCSIVCDVDALAEQRIENAVDAVAIALAEILEGRGGIHLPHVQGRHRVQRNGAVVGPSRSMNTKRVADGRCGVG